MTTPTNEPGREVAEGNQAEPACAGTNADGAPCGVSPRLLHRAEDGTYWCRVHDPDETIAAERRAASLRGALTSKIRHQGVSVSDLPPLTSPAAAQTWAERIGRAVALRAIPPKAGTAALRALSEWTRARDLHVRETHLRDLEAEVERLRREAQR